MSRARDRARQPRVEPRRVPSARALSSVCAAGRRSSPSGPGPTGYYKVRIYTHL